MIIFYYKSFHFNDCNEMKQKIRTFIAPKSELCMHIKMNGYGTMGAVCGWRNEKLTKYVWIEQRKWEQCIGD